MKLTVADTQHRPSDCDDCSCSSAAIKAFGGCPQRVQCPPCTGNCDQGRKCPAPRGVHQAQAFATTEPGDLAPLREARPPRGAGVALAVVLVLCAVCIAVAIGLALQGAPR